MKEKIEKMNVGGVAFPKLKGHTCIELTDVKTGKVERIESDNLVTNAVSEFLSFWSRIVGWNFINKFFMPLSETLFGGIYLFDTALTESADNKFLPNAATSRLVAHAGRATSDGLDNERGNFNFEESEALSNGYKYVWDFGTNEGNGTIACACLTSHIAGFHGYNYEPTSVMRQYPNNTGSFGNNYKGMQMDDTANTSGDPFRSRFWPRMQWYSEGASYPARLVCAGNTKFEQTANEIQMEGYRTGGSSSSYIARLNIKINDIGLNDRAGRLTYDNQTLSVGVANYDGAVPHDIGTKIFLLRVYSNDLYWAEVDKTTHTATATGHIVFNDLNIEQRGIETISDSYSSTGTNKSGSIYRNGHIYFLMRPAGSNDTSGVNGYVAKINVSTKAISIITPMYTLINMIHTSYSRHLMEIDNNGNIYAGGYVIDANDNYYPIQASRSNSISNYTCPSVSSNYCTLVKRADEATGLMPNFRYLATINNLDTPIVKTSSKTMKITYTLTEE